MIDRVLAKPLDKIMGTPAPSPKPLLPTATTLYLPSLPLDAGAAAVHVERVPIRVGVHPVPRWGQGCAVGQRLRRRAGVNVLDR